MKESYFPETGVWLKGNLHSHSTVSDGFFAPEALAKLYADKGYDFLSLSDHNVFVPHTDLEKNNLLLLTGVEHDIEYSPDKCFHVVGTGAPGRTDTTYPCRRYSKQEKTDQQLVDLMHGDGQFVVVAHPVWSRMEPGELLALQNCNAVEVYNNGTEHLCHGGNAEVLWDLMLRHGKRVFATASDDVHIPCDLFGGWIWVKAKARTPAAVMEALFAGAFYASSGPRIEDYGIDGRTVYVECSDCREIHFVTYEPRGKSVFAKNGERITQAQYTLTGQETYVRAVCVDQAGRSAWTQPILFGAPA